ncbi:MAG: RNA-binding protein [Clostridiaceae bacterium]|nr:RNA-binding protein [Clostridiaceae bacterium]
MEYNLGELVCSKAGRDAGRKFVVVGIVDNRHVLISDGSLRKIEKPKKKKIKHIESCGVVIDSLGEKLKNKIKISNAEIKKEIMQYIQD